MKVSWTTDQEKAITSFGKGVTVSAAAGSGKTAVLIERIIRLLTDKSKNIPADRLLAVTFTIDAAAQMRDKLNIAFEKYLAKDPTNAWVLQQQNLVQLARISTIDSFCFDMVKENLNSFDYQGGLKILGDAERILTFDNAFTLALEELCESCRDEFTLLDNFFDTENGQLKEVVNMLFDHLRTICFRDRWIKSALKNYESDGVFAELKEHAFKKCEALLARAKRVLDDARYCLNYRIDAGGKSYELKTHFKSASENVSLCEELVMGLELALEHRDAKALTGLEMPAFKQLRISGKPPEDVKGDLTAVKDRLKNDMDIIKQKVSETQSGHGLSDEHLKNNLKQSNRIFKAIVHLEELTEEKLNEIKLEKNAVDFSDIELMTKELLVTETEEGFKRTPLAEEIRALGLYKIIMIDEYQDVNDIQEIIFKAVSDTDDLDEMGQNTFIVGDMKQAIYGFRQTNPELFKACIAKAADPDRSERLEHITLKKNFRSRPEVLGLSNFIFETLMSEGCGQVDYRLGERLEAGAQYTPRRSKAEIMLVDAPDDNSGRCEEFYQVAKRIRELIDKGAPVCEDAEKGIDRPCRQSDFCILVNTNENIKQAAEALKAFGLQALCEDTAGYIRAREISLALDMLRAVDNPMNDIALTGVMMSPIMGFSPDEMMAVRERCKNKGGKKLNHIYQVLSGAARKKGTDEAYAKYVDMGSALLQQKCVSAYGLIENLRYCSMSLSLERLIRRIFDSAELMAISSLYLDAAKKRANLRLLLEYAADYEQGGGDGITGFLRFIDSVSGNDKAFKNAVTLNAGSDSVNVKTYHKSKGLEYPYVYLCTLSKKILKDSSDPIKLHKTAGYGFEIRDRRLNVGRVNLYNEYLSDKLDSELKSERLRLFYVGCTRAMEKLTLVLSNEKTGKTTHARLLEALRDGVKASANEDRVSAAVMQEQESVLAWVVMALAKHEYRAPLEDWLGMSLDFVPISPRSGEAVIEYYTCGQGEQADAEIEEARAEDTAPADPQLALKLRERYKYVSKSLTGSLPAKLTVTEIVEAQEYEGARAAASESGEDDDAVISFYPNLPRLSDELDKLTPAERGTCTHRFMELADYDRAAENVREELNRLTQKGYFTKKEAEGVYVESLERFVKTPLFERMRASSDLRREQKFLASVEDMGLSKELAAYTGSEGFIQGIADCIFKEDDGYVLIDYKTDNFSTEDDAGKYAVQLKLYKAAFELILGEKVKSSIIYSFRLGKGLYFDL